MNICDVSIMIQEEDNHLKEERTWLGIDFCWSFLISRIYHISCQREKKMYNLTKVFYLSRGQRQMVH